MDEDLKVFVQHLLGKTPGRAFLYPKVTVHKTSKVHTSHYFAAELVERKKKKMIVLQEFDALDGTLEFTKVDGTMNNEKWRQGCHTGRPEASWRAGGWPCPLRLI
jgi:hypothetical protein